MTNGICGDGGAPHGARTILMHRYPTFHVGLISKVPSAQRAELFRTSNGGAEYQNDQTNISYFVADSVRLRAGPDGDADPDPQGRRRAAVR